LKKELEVFVTEKKIIEEAERIEKLVSAKIAEIMKVQESEEESKDEPKEEKVEEEKVEESEEEKKDESKGIVDGEKEEKSEASEKLGDEFLKNTVIERDGNGMSFYMIRGESKWLMIK